MNDMVELGFMVWALAQAPSSDLPCVQDQTLPAEGRGLRSLPRVEMEPLVAACCWAETGRWWVT